VPKVFERTYILKTFIPKSQRYSDIFYLYTKFGDSRFSRFGDTVALQASKLKMGYATLTTPFLGVVCHLKARTSYNPPVCEI